VAFNASWSPWSRLYVQAGVNYVNSGLETPAQDYTAAVLKAQNNYWSANLNSGLVLDDKTDLNLAYTYYRADNYTDNTPVGVPYGSGAEEHGISTTLTRRINKNLRASLRYGYYNYSDESAGGHRDYEAHVVFTSLQYRF
jgi:outer membrane protein assembly factor BamA